MKNKKGQIQTLGNLPDSIIVLVVAIVILVLGVVIVQEMRDIDIVASGEDASFTSETVSTVTETTETLVCNTYSNPTCTITSVVNETDGFVVPTANYTQVGCGVRYSGTVMTGGLNGTDWNVTYTCTFGGESYRASNQSLIALGDFSDFVPLIVIALAAAIVIGLILLGFAGRRQER